MTRRPPRSPLFPCTTLFRSLVLRLVLVDPPHQLVEQRDEFLGRQIEGGEVVHGGAQPPHGGRRVQPVPDDVPDHERDPRSEEHTSTPVTPISRMPSSA